MIFNAHLVVAGWRSLRIGSLLTVVPTPGDRATISVSLSDPIIATGGALRGGLSLTFFFNRRDGDRLHRSQSQRTLVFLCR